jgi:transposase InsO family protein
VLFVFLVLSNERRRVVHFNVMDSPTAIWTGQQIVEAFPWDTAPTYLLRDRDGIFGDDFARRVESMGIKQVLISARSPWQNPYVERVIGSIRRECVDHTIILNERHLRWVLRDYFIGITDGPPNLHVFPLGLVFRLGMFPPKRENDGRSATQTVIRFSKTRVLCGVLPAPLSSTGHRFSLGWSFQKAQRFQTISTGSILTRRPAGPENIRGYGA